MKFNRVTFLGTPRPSTYDRRESMWVYVIHDDGRCKVGVSNNPGARLKQLTAGNARPVECAWSFYLPSRPLALAVEREVHRLLADKTLGREWFALGADAAIEVCEGVCAVAFELLDKWNAAPPDQDDLDHVIAGPDRRRNLGYDEARESAARRLGLR